MIHWPEHYDPEHAPVHVRNELAIAAPPESVWAWLVRAEAWPRWYPNSADVRIEGGGGELALGTRFRWRTFGVAIRSQVKELVAPERLAWDARGLGIDAYHAWWIERVPGGCRVVTEETQHGFAARLGALLLPRRMSRGHDLWLARLAAQATSGPPKIPA